MGKLFTEPHHYFQYLEVAHTFPYCLTEVVSGDAMVRLGLLP